MPRRSWIILVVVVVAVCAAAVLLVWRPFDDSPTIVTKALGVWQEQTTAGPVRMTVSAADAADDVHRYWVTLSLSQTPFPGGLEGDTIVIRDENKQDVAWEIAYGEGADVLLVTRPATGERHILRRVSR